MGFLDRALDAVGLQRKMTSLDLFREIYGGVAAKAGVEVNWKTALQCTAALSCAKVIAEGVAQIPWRVYQEVGGGRQIASDHNVNSLIYRRPNSWQTSFEFRETLVFHAIFAGNAYVFKNMVGSRREIRELLPLEPARIVADQKDDLSIQYKVTGKDGTVRIFGQDEIWHLRGPSWDSWSGLDGVKLAREAIGLAIATEETHATLHKNGTQTSGLYSVDGTLSKEKYDKILEWIKTYAVGGKNQHAPMILDQGAKFTAQQMTGVDSQHIETRKFQIEEICRAFRVMPIMVGQSDKAATYASAEQMFLAHIVHTLAPWYERIEQSANASLLTDQDFREGYYTKFTPNALMRGAAKDRADYFQKALGSLTQPGWMSQNEVRALEEQNRIPDGDVVMKPQGMSNGQPPNAP